MQFVRRQCGSHKFNTAARTTKEDVENASGEGEQECWFGEGGKDGRFM